MTQTFVSTAARALMLFFMTAPVQLDWPPVWLTLDHWEDDFNLSLSRLRAQG